MDALFSGGTMAGARQVLLEDVNLTMRLSEAEIDHAQTIKAMVESDDSLKELTDFEYVQYALSHPSTVTPLSTILGHIAQIQAFREEYSIQDTVEEGTKAINDMSLQSPGLFLSIHYLPTGGNCIAINDWAAFHPQQIVRTPQGHSTFLKGSYYRFQCMSPTFFAIREGMSNMFECQGVSTENYDSTFQEQLFAELYLSYPKRHKEMYFVNSPSIVNLAYSLWKKYMTPNMKETFHLGYQIEGLQDHRLDVLFKTPTPEAGRQNMVLQAQQLLLVRYHHQTTYRLPEPVAEMME